MTRYSKYNIIYLLQKWMDSVPGQTFLNYAYSWGASIVILGTLFKLTHLPGANLMLFIGMGTEVLVFFLSAFDRPFDKTADGMDLSRHYGAEQEGNAEGEYQPEGEIPAEGEPQPEIGYEGQEGGQVAAVYGNVGGGTIIIGGGGGGVVDGTPVAAAVDGTNLPEGQVVGTGSPQGGATTAWVAQQQRVSPEMAEATENYVEELKRTTAAKASMESELKIAHNIQMAMLPKTFPAYPERQDVDIYGQVMPAKAVGGDLYDFFIRDEKLFFYIGDVSGKGVPASLFMAVTCSLMHNISSYTQDADQIMQALNNAISSRNDTVMFVTFFLGVLDLKSGSLSYANGGHNPPLLLTGDDAEELSCDANVPVGVMEGWEFTVQQLQLKSGDTLFLYTDGLNEAEDCDYQQFGMDRIKATIRQVCNDKTSQQGVDSQMLVSAMTDAVKRFAGDAEQSDDLTMLAIGYNGNENDNDNQTTIGQ